MFIRLLSQDIPKYWEMIKFVCRTADGIPEQQLGPYLEELLVALLSDKAQFWVRLDDQRNIILAGVTRIMYDPQYNEKYFLLQTAYSWKREPVETWMKDLVLLKDFALKEGCKTIRFHSRNPRIWELAQASGFFEHSRIYQYPIT